MIKELYKYLLLLVTAVFAVACVEDVEEPSYDDAPVPDMNHPMRFNVGTMTKVSNENIKNETFIIYDYVDGQLYIDGSQYHLKYSATDDGWCFYDKSNVKKDFYWTETGTHEFFAFNNVEYYSYGSGFRPLNYDYNKGAPRINLSGINLQQGSNRSEFDLIYSMKTRDVEADGYGSITLPFNHAFSSLLFEVKNEYPVEMSISGISLKNVRTTSAGSGYYLSFADGLEPQGNTDETYSGGSLTIASGESAIAFGGSVLAWPQGFGGSPFIKLEFNEKSKTVDIRSLGIYSLGEGYKYSSTITLTPMNLDLEVKELVREYVGGALKSKLTLSLSADKDLSEISDLQITVNKKGGVSLGTYTIGTVSSNEVVVERVADMEVGDYTISYSFKDGIGHVYNHSFDYPAKTPRPAQQQFNYIYADGSQGNDVRNDIVGVIIYHGNPKTQFNDTALPDQYCNGLAISVASRKCAWNSTQLSSIPASVKLSGQTTVIGEFNMGGYTATQAFGSNNYTVFDNGTAPAGTSGWYLGAANEWKYILTNKDEINKLLEGVGDAINPSDNVMTDAYWLPYFYSTRAAIVYISGGVPRFYYQQYYYRPDLPDYCYNARPIFAF